MSTKEVSPAAQAILDRMLQKIGDSKTAKAIQDAHDALHRQVQHLRVPEFVAQLFFGRINDHALALLEHEITDFGESP